MFLLEGFLKDRKRSAAVTAGGWAAVHFRRAAPGGLGRRAHPNPQCPFPARPTHVSATAWQRRPRNQTHLLAMLHQLVPNKRVHLRASEREDFVQRSAGMWEGPVIPVTRLLASLCFLLSFLHFSSFSKENLVSLFSFVNPTVCCLGMIMRSSTCSEL